MKFEYFLKEKGVETIKEKSAEELAKLYNEFNEKIADAMRQSIDTKVDKEVLDEMRKEFHEIQIKQLTELNEVLKQQGLQIKEVTKTSSVGDKKGSFLTQLRKELEDNRDKLKDLKEGKEGSGFKMTFKAAMTLANNVSGGNLPVEDRLQGFDLLPSRATRFYDALRKQGTESNVVSWISQTNRSGVPGQIAEGGAKTNLEFDLVIASESVRKTAAHIKVSTEMLNDVSWIMGEIENDLIKQVLKAVEKTAYDGDGTGQNHNGVSTVATAFSAGTFADKVDNANDVDVLTVAINQIRVAQEGDSEVNHIFMHPTDVTKLLMVKISSTDKRYVDRLVRVGSEMSLDGIPIIPTTLLTEGTYLVGDFMHALLVSKEEVSIEIGMSGTDFINNFRTILAEFRGLTLIKTNKRTAFVKGDFATDKAVLEAP